MRRILVLTLLLATSSLWQAMTGPGFGIVSCADYAGCGGVAECPDGMTSANNCVIQCNGGGAAVCEILAY